MAQSGTIETIAEAAGYRVHERARESWTAVFEMLALNGRFAALTRGQTARTGLTLLGDEGPIAVLGRFDHATEHLECLLASLKAGRSNVELAMSGAIERAFVGAAR